MPLLWIDNWSLDAVDAFVSSSSFLEWTGQDDKVLGVLCVLCNDSFSLVAVYDCGQEKQELPNRSRTPSFQNDCLMYMTINSCAIDVDLQSHDEKSCRSEWSNLQAFPFPSQQAMSKQKTVTRRTAED